MIKVLIADDDQNLRRDIGKNEDEILKLVQQYFNCG